MKIGRLMLKRSINLIKHPKRLPNIRQIKEQIRELHSRQIDKQFSIFLRRKVYLNIMRDVIKPVCYQVFQNTYSQLYDKI